MLNAFQRQMVDLTVRFQKKRDPQIAHEAIKLLLQTNGEELQLARWVNPRADISGLDARNLSSLQSKFPQPFLTLGGGSDYCYPFFRNLDPQSSDLNPFPYELAANEIFPVRSRSCEIVYLHNVLLPTSDHDHVRHVCSEAARVVSEAGTMIVTAPTSTHFNLRELCAVGEMKFASDDRDRILRRYGFVPRISADSAARKYAIAFHREKRNDL